jgi:hypothetical protein
MVWSEHYHVGIVVPDIKIGAAKLTELIGVTWGPIVDTDALAIRDGSGRDLEVPNRICYSTSPPYLELIEEAPGTVWVCNEYSNLHHMGFWSEQLTGDSTHFATSQCPLEICGRDGGVAPITFAYHRDPLGIRFELVDVAIKPMMEDSLFKPAQG